MNDADRIEALESEIDALLPKVTSAAERMGEAYREHTWLAGRTQYLQGEVHALRAKLRRDGVVAEANDAPGNEKRPVALVGIVGYAGAGKDEAANALVALGFERVKFADPLRDMLAALDPLVGPRQRYSDLLAAHGYEGAKQHSEVRRLLQRLGTDAGRNVLGENIWVDAWRERASRLERVVTTDVRFPNEVDAIRELGGLIVRVDRPGVGPVNAHESERLPEVVVPDIVIRNDSSIDVLHERVREVVLSLSAAG